MIGSKNAVYADPRRACFFAVILVELDALLGALEAERATTLTAA